MTALCVGDEHLLTHDIRTWLTVIRGHVQLLQRDARRRADPDPRLLASLGIIDQAVTAIVRQIDRLEATSGTRP